MPNISLADLTNGSVVNDEWVGTSILDVLISTVNQNINIQYDKGRITGGEYADVYLGSLQTIISESINFLLKEKLTEEEIMLAKEKIDTEKINQDAIIAKTKDIHGKIIDGSGIITVDLSNTNAHFYEQGIREQEELKREQEVKISTATVDNTIIGGHAATASILRDYGYSVTYDVDGNPSFDSNNTNPDVLNTSGIIPGSKFEADMMRQRVESNIGINTAKGYVSDVLYKQSKVLQELIFSLANSGVIDEAGGTEPAGNTIYGKLTASMEKSLNGMVSTFGENLNVDDVTPIVDIDSNAGATDPTFSN
ncbi:MAG: hypothetical protein L3I99_01940 [Sulfurimonas sp.]|nr:hypothetical protein [Sulfurimonas sp.]